MASATINATFSASLWAQKARNFDIIDIGSRWELFVDTFLIDQFSGTVELQLHHPVMREVVMVYDEPWEGNTCAYHSIFKDGDIFRMYYRGSQIDVTREKFQESHPWYICYAESDDGIHWRRPHLGIYDFKGSKENNIVLADGNLGGLKIKMSDNAQISRWYSLEAYEC